MLLYVTAAIHTHAATAAIQSPDNMQIKKHCAAALPAAAQCLIEEKTMKKLKVKVCSVVYIRRRRLSAAESASYSIHFYVFVADIRASPAQRARTVRPPRRCLCAADDIAAGKHRRNRYVVTVPRKFYRHSNTRVPALRDGHIYAVGSAISATIASRQRC